MFFEFKFPEMRCARREDPVLLEEGVGTHPFIKMSIASAGTHGEEGRRRRRGESERESVGRGRTGRSSGPASFGWRRWRLFFLSFFFSFYAQSFCVQTEQVTQRLSLWKTTGIL